MNVILRTALSSDLETLKRWRNDREVQRLLMARYRPHDDELVRAWLRRWHSDPTGKLLFIASDAPQPCGFVQLAHMDRIAGHTYLGMMIDGEYRGTGLAEAALRLAEDRVRELKLRKIMLECAQVNTRALRFWRRTGYRDVGILKAHHIVDGEPMDVCLLEKLL